MNRERRNRVSINFQLSNSMKQALRSAVRRGLLTASKNTTQALLSRGLVTESGDLTVSGREYGLESLPLDEQCRLLGLVRKTVNDPLPASRPEESVLRSMWARGTAAYFTENTYGVHIVWYLAYPLTRIWEVLSRERLYGLEPLMRKHRRRLLRMTARLGVLLIRPNVILNTYRRLDARRRTNDSFYTDLWPRELYTLLTTRIGRENLAEIIRLVSVDPDTYGRGWPDITCFDDEVPFFVEVKTSDRLQLSQIRTIPALMSATGMRVECWQLVHQESAQ